MSSHRSHAAPALHLLTGKGGVGKTTLAVALALEARRAGRRPIVVELGHRSSLSAVIEGAAANEGAAMIEGARQTAAVPIGHAPTEVWPGLWASNVSLDHALTDYLVRRVRSRRLARGITASAPLATFFDAAPAVSELLTLEHVEALLGDFDPVIVDLDATGHALMFLELPGLLAQLAPRGPIGELVRSLGALLLDRARTRIHLVTLPLALPIEETLELHGELARRGCPLGTIVVNRRAPRPIAPSDDAHARALLSVARDALDREALALALEDATRWDAESVALSRLACTGLPRLVLAERAPEDGRDRLSLEALAAMGAEAREVLA